MLENNIQIAIQKNGIDLEDAIDVRDIKNLKLANQLLKIRRKAKQVRDQEMQQQTIQAQSKANAESQQVAAQAEVQKQQALTQSKIELEQSKSGFESQKMQQEASLKKDLMNHEFQLNMQLKQMEMDTANSKENIKEDRKDERTRIQASQQSDLIEQRKSGTPPKKFESTGNDVMGGIDMGGFDVYIVYNMFNYIILYYGESKSKNRKSSGYY